MADRGEVSHSRTQVFISLVAGFILGMAIFHLMPQGYHNISGPDPFEKTIQMVALGIVTMVCLLVASHYHVHDVTPPAGQDGVSAGEHDHHVGHVALPSVLAMSIGLGLHIVYEGLGIGASIVEGTDVHSQILPGLAVFIAVLLHKPLDTYSIVGLMRVAGFAGRQRMQANLFFSLLCPVSMTVVFLGLNALAGNEAVIGYILAFTSGVFLCIALTDLLPELSFHSGERMKLVAALCIGFGLAFGLYLFESVVPGFGGGSAHGHG